MRRGAAGIGPGRLLDRLPPRKKGRANGTTFFPGGSGWIRTTEVVDNRFTVCPLWPLGNAPICSCRLSLRGEGGAGRRTRTPDLLITNQLLYQLSYTSTISDESYDSRLSLICQPKNLFLEEFFLHTVHKRHRDLQRSAPAAECALCGGGLYPGETCWRIWGRVLCGECAGPWLLDGLTFCRVRLREVRK